MFGGELKNRVTDPFFPTNIPIFVYYHSLILSRLVALTTK